MGIKQIGTGQSGLYQLNISIVRGSLYHDHFCLKYCAERQFTLVPPKAATNNGSCWLVGDLGGWGGGQNHHRSETQPVARDLDVTQHQLFYRNTTTTSPTTELLTTSRNRVFMCSYDLYSRTGCTTSSSLSTEAFYYLIISFNFTSDRAEVCGVGRV